MYFAKKKLFIYILSERDKQQPDGRRRPIKYWLRIKIESNYFSIKVKPRDRILPELTIIATPRQNIIIICGARGAVGYPAWLQLVFKQKFKSWRKGNSQNECFYRFETNSLLSPSGSIFECLVPGYYTFMPYILHYNKTKKY